LKFAYPVYHHGENRCSTVWAFIPVHTGDDGMTKVHTLDGVRNPLGL
jgi:hypothetical protein